MSKSCKILSFLAMCCFSAPSHAHDSNLLTLIFGKAGLPLQLASLAQNSLEVWEHSDAFWRMWFPGACEHVGKDDEEHEHHHHHAGSDGWLENQLPLAIPLFIRSVDFVTHALTSAVLVRHILNHSGKAGHWHPPKSFKKIYQHLHGLSLAYALFVRLPDRLLHGHYGFSAEIGLDVIGHVMHMLLPSHMLKK